MDICQCYQWCCEGNSAALNEKLAHVCPASVSSCTSAANEDDEDNDDNMDTCQEVILHFCPEFLRLWR